MGQLFAVWSPATLVGAIVAGALVGYLIVGRFASDPEYASLLASAREIGLLTAVLASLLGIVFYVVQAVSSYADGDPQWPRVISRFGLWLVYAGVLGIGTWLRLEHAAAQRKRNALAQAHREIDA